VSNRRPLQATPGSTRSSSSWPARRSCRPPAGVCLRGEFHAEAERAVASKSGPQGPLQHQKPLVQWRDYGKHDVGGAGVAAPGCGNARQALPASPCCRCESSSPVGRTRFRRRQARCCIVLHAKRCVGFLPSTDRQPAAIRC
jgi:hypothetical protein